MFLKEENTIHEYSGDFNGGIISLKVIIGTKLEVGNREQEIVYICWKHLDSDHASDG